MFLARRMVVPWVGFELATLLNRVGVRPEARHVAFETLVRPEEMWAQTRDILLVLAGIVAGVVAWRTDNMMATIGVGMGVLWTAQFVLG